MAMASGDFVAAMGRSGCGKSTLRNLMAGLDTPSDGEILVAGESLAGKNEDDLAPCGSGTSASCSSSSTCSRA